MLWLQLLVYLAVIVFVVATAARIWKYASAPVHLRWELYPVTADRDKPYGGSYYEEMEWWKHLPKKNIFHELLAMGEEILFLKGVYENNRSLWYASYPFHLGLYILVGLLGLLVVGGVAEMAGISVAIGSASMHRGGPVLPDHARRIRGPDARPDGMHRPAREEAQGPAAASP